MTFVISECFPLHECFLTNRPHTKKCIVLYSKWFWNAGEVCVKHDCILKSACCGGWLFLNGNDTVIKFWGWMIISRWWKQIDVLNDLKIEC